MAIFKPTDLLIPQKNINLEKWAVIACDQFTSDVDYWKSVTDTVGTAPSSLHLILSEIELGKSVTTSLIQQIHHTMKKYLKDGIFREFNNSYIYVERRMKDGKIRKGVVGIIDLEQYSFSEDKNTVVKPTEQTVVERIPPRKAVRDGASVELSHAILFIDDSEMRVIEDLGNIKDELVSLYDFTLMKGGGAIQGWLVNCEVAKYFEARLNEYCNRCQAAGDSAQFVVGDGNHSLATAKALYDELKTDGCSEDVLNKQRFAMVELENLYDDAIEIKPIHRILYNVDLEDFCNYIDRELMKVDSLSREEVEWVSGDMSGKFNIPLTEGRIAVEVIQPILDRYVTEFQGTIDYIHGDEELIKLAQNKNSVGILMPTIDKSDLFEHVSEVGVYPRKTFSVGEAEEKRYYLEARQIL